jgi:hypothetical protein
MVNAQPFFSDQQTEHLYEQNTATGVNSDDTPALDFITLTLPISSPQKSQSTLLS